MSSSSVSFNKETSSNTKSPGKVALVFRPRKTLSNAVFEAISFLRDKDVDISIIGDHPLAKDDLLSLGIRSVVSWEDSRKALPEMLVAFGGDGTLLHSLNELGYPSDTLFLGINSGNLGFLTEGELEEGKRLLASIWDGKYWVDRRFLLHIGLWRDDSKIWEGYSLNELLVRQEQMARPLKARLFIDQVEMASIQADGFIVATPTGSTAYALSAGGPIIHPFLSCFEITPVAPHSMNSRSIVVHDRGVASLVLDSTWHCAKIYVDGMGKCDLQTDDRVTVSASKRKVSFVRVKQHHYYKTLREKLSWNL